MKVRVTLNVNGDSRETLVPVHKTLLEVLREDLGLTGTKHGCELGECGTCTVLLDNQPVLSCLVLGQACAGRAPRCIHCRPPSPISGPRNAATALPHSCSPPRRCSSTIRSRRATRSSTLSP